MAKNVVICCDGTANEFARNNTNVVKLYSALVHDQPSQCTYYHPGVGTMEPPGALTPLARRFTRVLGLALGAYLENDIRDAYVFLMNVYHPEDKVFLFGFSRGAYTVRAVASLLHMYGLLRPGNEALVPYAIRMMTAITKAREKPGEQAYQKEIKAYFDLAAQFKATMSRDCKPWFVGIWDTVSSVGWIENPLRLPFSADNPDIEIGRHAVAIDERRAFFRSNLWKRSGSPDVPHGPRNALQVWFPGVHCDVGGGYPEDQSGLSKLALEWMLDEAEPFGLMVNQQQRRRVLGDASAQIGDFVYQPPNPDGPIHESLAGAWKLAEYVPKRHFNWTTRQEEHRMNRSRRRTIPPGSWVHWSAYERQGNYAGRLPKDAKPTVKKGPGTNGH
jgi:uncharacterized protein (DUF2235 family)